jgi:NAD(P)-dependent dehydrogenase (short-subunit alcohol dehydrogenase family)
VTEQAQPKRAALITGANGGIGQALCAAFADAGYRVIATDVAQQYAQHSPLLHAYIPLDLAVLPRNPELQSDFLQRLIQQLDGCLLHVCVNNAAVQIIGALSEIADQDFQRTFDVNVFAPLVLARLLLPLLEASGGSIINIGSVHARATKPGFVSYATSKSALHGLTQALAVDVGGRIRVNTIQPAAVATEMLRAGFADNPRGYAAIESYHPVGRIAEPREIARMAVMLASDDASFVNGAALDMHGGIGIRLHDPD